MSSEMTMYLVLGAVAGGFINGLSGTGTALFALGFYLVAVDPVTAVAIVTLMSVLAGIQGLWVVRDAIRTNAKRPLRFILPGLVGVPIGLALLAVINAGQLRLGIATMLIIYGGYFSFRTSLPAFTKPTPYIDNGIGFVGGILGGAAGISGALPAMWVSMRPWPKAEMRAIMQSFNMAILTTTVIILFFKGAYDAQAVRALVITVPTGLIAAQIGIFAFGKLSDGMFRRLLIGLTFLMGIGVLISEIT